MSASLHPGTAKATPVVYKNHADYPTCLVCPCGGLTHNRSIILVFRRSALGHRSGIIEVLFSTVLFVHELGQDALIGLGSTNKSKRTPPPQESNHSRFMLHRPQFKLTVRIGLVHDPPNREDLPCLTSTLNVCSQMRGTATRGQYPIEISKRRGHPPPRHFTSSNKKGSST